MLVLSRKVTKGSNEVRIGEEIVVRVLEIRGNTVRLGIIAPPEIPVLRQEILDRTSEPQQQPPTDESAADAA